MSNRISKLIEKELTKNGSIELQESEEEDLEFNFEADQEKYQGDLDFTDSDFEETDSETEAASLKAISEIESLILKREKRKEKKRQKKLIIPSFAKTKAPTKAKGPKKIYQPLENFQVLKV
ncbi:hypothetical protein AYI68_g4016 [Smittium mucronatum]|uniref:Vps72/YL1 N-terminal domain-containing protein n=1 Tax=Smittium mucronatum TaxID=133383 RepID=A0A1R0GYF2_9FUNG|nr:hypothetical protein AYI68_g4016 [Smittium mucronatum]